MCDSCNITPRGDNRYDLCDDCNEDRIDEENAVFNADWIDEAEDKVFGMKSDVEYHDLRDTWESRKDWRAIAAMKYGVEEETKVGQWCVVCINTSGYHRSVLVMATNLRDAIKDGLEVAEFVHSREMRNKV